VESKQKERSIGKKRRYLGKAAWWEKEKRDGAKEKLWRVRTKKEL
jgi:hypothetical protein